MGDKLLVSVVIPTYNRKEKLIRLIQSILKSDYPKDKMEIIVVDDASTDRTYEMLKTKRFNLTNFKIIKNLSTKWVAESRNIGASNACGEYILFIDDDVIIKKECIKYLVSFLEENKDFVAVSPLILDCKGDIWNSGVKRYYVGINRSCPIKDSNSKYIEVDECITIYLIRREYFVKIGGFNPNYKFFYEESEMFERLKKKTSMNVSCLLTAKAYHCIDKSKLGKIPRTKAFMLGRNRIRFYRQWCSSNFHFFLASTTFLTLILSYYLVIFLKNFHSWIDLMRGFYEGMTKGNTNE